MGPKEAIEAPLDTAGKPPPPDQDPPGVEVFPARNETLSVAAEGTEELHAMVVKLDTLVVSKTAER